MDRIERNERRGVEEREMAELKDYVKRAKESKLEIVDLTPFANVTELSKEIVKMLNEMGKESMKEFQSTIMNWLDIIHRTGSE